MLCCLVIVVVLNMFDLSLLDWFRFLFENNVVVEKVESVYYLKDDEGEKIESVIVNVDFLFFLFVNMRNLRLFILIVLVGKEVDVFFEIGKVYFLEDMMVV